MRRWWLLALVVGALMAVAVPAAGATAQATSTTPYSFELATPNTAVAPTAGMMAMAGDWIRLTGGGEFDPVAGTVGASGTFVHYNADGTVHCKGTWKATALSGWTDFGGNADGEHGGVLSLVVTHFCKTMGMIHTGIPMTVTSTLNAPDGSSYTEGTTTGDFTKPTGGAVVIQQEW